MRTSLQRQRPQWRPAVYEIGIGIEIEFGFAYLCGALQHGGLLAAAVFGYCRARG